MYNLQFYMQVLISVRKNTTILWNSSFVWGTVAIKMAIAFWDIDVNCEEDVSLGW